MIGIDATTGTQAWSFDVTGRAVGLAAGQGHVIVSTDAGYVYCFGKTVIPSPAATIAISHSEAPYPAGPVITL